MSAISCRSSAGQGKFAGQRPTFATVLHNQPSIDVQASVSHVMSASRHESDEWYRSLSTSSRMRAIVNHNWSARKQRLHLQSAPGISHHSALAEDRI